MYKFRKTDLKDMRLLESENYLSNGHWMARKALLSYDFKIEPETPKEDWAEKFIPKDPLLKVTRTNLIESPSTGTTKARLDVVVFFGKNKKGKDVFVGFNRRYVEIFGLEVLYGKDSKSAFTDDPKFNNVIIMPKSIDFDGTFKAKN